MGSKVVIWNARGVARPSFKECLEKIIEAYDPIIVIITEARLSELSMRKIWIAKKLAWAWKLGSTGSLCGGFAVICCKERAAVQINFGEGLADGLRMKVRVVGPRSVVRQGS